MTKFRAAIAAAAALIIAGGITVGQALYQAGQSEGLTCAEWNARAKEFNNKQTKRHFYVAIQNGTPIPKAFGNKVLGDCAAGVCTVQPNGCDLAITCEYDISPLVSGWRLAEVWAHPYFATGWYKAAGGTPGLRWYKSMRDVVAACRAHFTGAQCLQLLQADSKCWLLNDGHVCRYGLEYGPGIGGADADGIPVYCRYADVLSPLPCTVYNGAGSELSEANEEWPEDVNGDLEIVPTPQDL
jgi:hypothetical protein